MRIITAVPTPCPCCGRTWSSVVAITVVDGVIPEGTVACLLACRNTGMEFEGTARVWEAES
jgi:hypothetical protein